MTRRSMRLVEGPAFCNTLSTVAMASSILSIHLEEWVSNVGLLMTLRTPATTAFASRAARALADDRNRQALAECAPVLRFRGTRRDAADLDLASFV